MLVGSLELNVDLLLCFQVLRRSHIEVNGEGLVPIDPAKVPLVSFAHADFCRRDVVVVGRLDWGDLADGTADFEVRAGHDFALGQEAHLEFSVIVDVEELFETFFEHGVTEGRCHNVESSSHFNA